MLRGERTDWYLPVLIVGTALAAFLLGSATTIWLGSAPLPALARGAALPQGATNVLGENQTTGSAGSPAGRAQMPAAQPAAPGSAQPGEAAAASAAQPTGSPTSASGGNQTTGPGGSPAGRAQMPAAQPPAPGSAQPAEAAAASAAPTPPATAASSAQPVASPATAPGAVSAAIPQGSDFSLQLGAFLDAAKAKSLTDRLAARGYSPTSIEAADGYGRTWHYVRLGAFADEGAAALAASDLLERAGIGAAVVRLSTANAGR
jgi:cell division septation protein DedD